MRSATLCLKNKVDWGHFEKKILPKITINAQA